MGKIILDDDIIKLPFYASADIMRVFLHALLTMDWEGCLKTNDIGFVKLIYKHLRLTQGQALHALKLLINAQLITEDDNGDLWVANPEKFMG